MRMDLYESCIKEPSQYDFLETSPAAYEELEQLMKRVRSWCLKYDQDWPILFAGVEGSGKSTMALQIAKMLDPEFKISDSMIFSVADGPHSYESFLKKFRGVKGKVAFFDEAVEVFYTQEHNTVESRTIQKIFKTKRSYSHFDMIIAPSIWDLVPDIRDRRTKSLIYTFIAKGRKRNSYVHMFAYFAAPRISQILKHKNLKLLLRTPKELFKFVTPNLVGVYPKLDEKTEADYLSLKKMNQKSVEETGFGAIHAKYERQSTKSAPIKTPIPENVRAELLKRYATSIKQSD